MAQRKSGYESAFTKVRVGKAAEHRVCADLLLKGFNAFVTDAGLPYDVVVEVGNKLWRIQVKATLKPRSRHARGGELRYVFLLGPKGARHTRPLDITDCDLIALVALDINTTAYLAVGDVGFSADFLGPEQPLRLQLKRNKPRLSRLADFTFESAVGLAPKTVPYREQTLYEQDGEKRSLEHWVKKYANVTRATVSRRLALGWELKRALTHRIRRKRNPAVLDTL